MISSSTQSRRPNYRSVQLQVRNRKQRRDWTSDGGQRGATHSRSGGVGVIVRDRVVSEVHFLGITFAPLDRIAVTFPSGAG
jgi:hypothetical protein